MLTGNLCKMVVGQGFGVGKLLTIAVWIMVTFGLLFSVVTGAIHWKKTGEKGPFIDATLGQVFYWDSQLLDSAKMIKNEEHMKTIPESFREVYREFLVQQIVFYLILFFLLSFGLYKFGNWIMGQQQFEPTTDIILILVILLVIFPFSELVYGIVMDKPNIIPYRGVIELMKPSTWDAILLTTEIAGVNTGG